MTNEILYKKNNTTVYQNGDYKLEEDLVGINGSIFEYGSIVSVQFNQLKAKLFNLVEASITDKEQREAVKGLVKQFCNQNYSNTVKDLDGWIERLGFRIEVSSAVSEE